MAHLLLRPLRSPPSYLLLRPPPSYRLLYSLPVPLLRHHRTSSATLQKPTAPPPPDYSALNSPPSTLPAPLTLPVRSTSQSLFPYYLALGKSYLSFFKSGLRCVLTNYTSSRPIQNLADSAGSITALVERGAITRSQLQHLLRSRHDFRRLPVFALIFLVCGEFSPLVLPFVGAVVPGTCKIPRQLERERRKRQEAVERLEDGEEKSGREGERHVATVLGVRSWVPGLERWRVRRRVEYLMLDDELMARAGGARGLDAGEELVMAVEERGMRVYGVSEEELRAKMEWWEKIRTEKGEINPGWWLVAEEDWEDVL